MSAAHGTILGVVASGAGGSTDALVAAALGGAAAEGAATATIHLGYGPYEAERIAGELAAAGPLAGLVLGTPMYRATFAGILKDFLDAVPRGKPGDGYPSPLRALPIAVVATGASDHHFLGVDPLVALLVRFFGAYVVPPAIYASPKDFDEAKQPVGPTAGAARTLGATTVRLAAAIARDETLAAARPQV